ncbi:MAG: hypothetical protein LAP21_21460 [Acidobacteriia bacterium]|nr:hypothetical protein [Terriglobia bacterium]
MMTMYTGTMIEDLIQCVELAEERARDGVRLTTNISPEPPAYEMNWQDWQELVEVA